jgi:uncharacterized protein (UPF0332 family)
VRGKNLWPPKNLLTSAFIRIFTAARALLATKQLDSSKHSGVIALFNQNFVKGGVVRKEASKCLERAKLYREQADYGDFYLVSLQEAEAQIQSAREFIYEIEIAIANISKSNTNKEI